MAEIKLHQKQQWLMESKARFLGAISGIQGGKSTVGALWLLREIYEHYQSGKRGNWLIAAPTVKILQQSTLPKFKEFIPSDWGEWKEQRQCFDLAWGDTIYVRSTEEPDHLEGMTIVGAWLDEAGQMKNEAWINVQGRLSINMGRCCMTSTPYAPNWFWRDIMFKAGVINHEVQTGIERDPNIELFTWPSIDNPAFPQAEWDRAKASLAPRVFERRYCGKPTMLEGLVYPDISESHFIKAFPIPGEWKRFAGIDFGHTNPTAVLCIAQKPEVQAEPAKGQRHEPSVFYVYREFYKTGALLNQVAEFLNQEPLQYILGDPSAAQQIAELSRYYGVRRILPADNKIEIGIERISSLIRENRLFFLRGRTDNAIDEIQTYHYPAASLDRVVQDKPVAVKNHAMDALKYAFSRQVDGLYRGLVKKTKRSPGWAQKQKPSYDDPVTGYGAY